MQWLIRLYFGMSDLLMKNSLWAFVLLCILAVVALVPPKCGKLKTALSFLFITHRLPQPALFVWNTTDSRAVWNTRIAEVIF